MAVAVAHRTVVGARSMKGRRSMNSRGGALGVSPAAVLPWRLPPPLARLPGVRAPHAPPLGVAGSLQPALTPSSSPGRLAASRLWAHGSL